MLWLTLSTPKTMYDIFLAQGRGKWTAKLHVRHKGGPMRLSSQNNITIKYFQVKNAPLKSKCKFQ